MARGRWSPCEGPRAFGVGRGRVQANLINANPIVQQARLRPPCASAQSLVCPADQAGARCKPGGTGRKPGPRHRAGEEPARVAPAPEISPASRKAACPAGLDPLQMRQEPAAERPRCESQHAIRGKWSHGRRRKDSSCSVAENRPSAQAIGCPCQQPSPIGEAPDRTCVRASNGTCCCTWGPSCSNLASDLWS